MGMSECECLREMCGYEEEMGSRAFKWRLLSTTRLTSLSWMSTKLAVVGCSRQRLLAAAAAAAIYVYYVVDWSLPSDWQLWQLFAAVVNCRLNPILHIRRKKQRCRSKRHFKQRLSLDSSISFSFIGSIIVIWQFESLSKKYQRVNGRLRRKGER